MKIQITQQCVIAGVFLALRRRGKPQEHEVSIALLFDGYFGKLFRAGKLKIVKIDPNEILPQHVHSVEKLDKELLAHYESFLPKEQVQTPIVPPGSDDKLNGDEGGSDESKDGQDEADKSGADSKSPSEPEGDANPSADEGSKTSEDEELNKKAQALAAEQAAVKAAAQEELDKLLLKTKKTKAVLAKIEELKKIVGE